MRTDIKALMDRYRDILSKGVFEDCELKVTGNSKKEERGYASVTLTLTAPDAAEGTTVSLYIVEKPRNTLVIAVSKKNEDIIFTNFGSESVAKSEKYVGMFFERTIKRIKGLPIE